jgi:aspartyl protease family protein
LDGDQIARVAYLAIILAALGGWVLVEYRGRLGFAARSAMAWGMIFVAAMAGYGLWGDIRSSITPVQTVVEGGRIEVPRADDGHYYLTLLIDGQEIEFLADTGATNVVLSDRDAKKLGIDPEGLAYLGEADTANGVIQTADVSVRNVELGPYFDERITASVTKGAMEGSLLGMDYLGKYRIEIDQDTMILSR